MKTYIDPPAGWRYGFPKEFPDGVEGADAIHAWLVSEGYPQFMIDEFPEGLPYRFFKEETADEPVP